MEVRPKVVDCFTYNGERWILDLHLNILAPHVDKFIIVEAKTTFSGLKKPLYFSQHEQFFKKFWPKIDYFIIDESYTAEDIDLAQKSPNTKGASHWQREFLQKESLKKALHHVCNDEDVVYVEDVDEIWNPLYASKSTPERMKLRVYAYRLNNASNEEFWGILRGKWKDIKPHCLNHLRTDPTIRANEYGGWHFTSMGGIKEIKRKLDSSYTAQSYNTLEVQQNLPTRLKEGIDYLARSFIFEDETENWPPYLKKHQERYQHLMKNPLETLETIESGVQGESEAE